MPTHDVPECSLEQTSWLSTEGAVKDSPFPQRSLATIFEFQESESEPSSNQGESPVSPVSVKSKPYGYQGTSWASISPEFSSHFSVVSPVDSGKQEDAFYRSFQARMRDLTNYNAIETGEQPVTSSSTCADENNDTSSCYSRRTSRASLTSECPGGDQLVRYSLLSPVAAGVFDDPNSVLSGLPVRSLSSGGSIINNKRLSLEYANKMRPLTLRQYIAPFERGPPSSVSRRELFSGTPTLSQATEDLEDVLAHFTKEPSVNPQIAGISDRPLQGNQGGSAEKYAETPDSPLQESQGSLGEVVTRHESNKSSQNPPSESDVSLSTSNTSDSQKEKEECTSPSDSTSPKKKSGKLNKVHFTFPSFGINRRSRRGRDNSRSQSVSYLSWGEFDMVGRRGINAGVRSTEQKSKKESSPKSPSPSTGSRPSDLSSAGAEKESCSHLQTGTRESQDQKDREEQSSPRPSSDDRSSNLPCTDAEKDDRSQSPQLPCQQVGRTEDRDQKDSKGLLKGSIPSIDDHPLNLLHTGVEEEDCPPLPPYEQVGATQNLTEDPSREPRDSNSEADGIDVIFKEKIFISSSKDQRPPELNLSQAPEVLHELDAGLPSPAIKSPGLRKPICDFPVNTPDTAVFSILKSAPSLKDLFSIALINNRFYRVFKQHELLLMKEALFKMSPPAWEFREMNPPWDTEWQLLLDPDAQVPEYTPSLYLRCYAQDMYTLVQLKSLILARCGPFLRRNTVMGLAGTDSIHAARIDDAFWRIWTFCRIFGCGKNRENDIVGQVDWLNGGTIAMGEHKYNMDFSSASASDPFGMNNVLLEAPPGFAKGNEGGLSPEELYNMTEIWNCLGVLLQPLHGKCTEARQAGIYRNHDVPESNIGKEEQLLEEWTCYVLTLGLSAVLYLSSVCPVESAATTLRKAQRIGLTKWELHSSTISRSAFLKEAVSRAFESWRKDQDEREQSCEQIAQAQQLALTINNNVTNTTRFDPSSISHENNRSQWGVGVYQSMRKNGPVYQRRPAFASEIREHDKLEYLQLQHERRHDQQHLRPPQQKLPQQKLQPPQQQRLQVQFRPYPQPNQAPSVNEPMHSFAAERPISNFSSIMHSLL